MLEKAAAPCTTTMVMGTASNCYGPATITRCNVTMRAIALDVKTATLGLAVPTRVLLVSDVATESIPLPVVTCRARVDSDEAYNPLHQQWRPPSSRSRLAIRGSTTLLPITIHSMSLRPVSGAGKTTPGVTLMGSYASSTMPRL